MSQQWHEWLKRLCAERAKARAEQVIRAQAAADSCMGKERDKRLIYARAIEQEMYLRHDEPHASVEAALAVAEYLGQTRIMFRDGWKPEGVR